MIDPEQAINKFGFIRYVHNAHQILIELQNRLLGHNKPVSGLESHFGFVVDGFNNALNCLMQYSEYGDEVSVDHSADLFKNKSKYVMRYTNDPEAMVEQNYHLHRLISNFYALKTSASANSDYDTMLSMENQLPIILKAIMDSFKAMGKISELIEKKHKKES